MNIISRRSFMKQSALTIRPKGHVLPENAERDLPEAVSAIRKAGLIIDTTPQIVIDAMKRDLTTFKKYIQK